MRLSTRLHGMMDYALGVILIGVGSTMAGGIGGTPGMVLAVTGVIAIVNALITNFELGVLKKIHIPTHLWLDGIVGLAVALSPWLLSFDRDVWLPHVLVGALIMVAAFFTDTVPGVDRRRPSVAGA
jgi:hypothetical protein